MCKLAIRICNGFNLAFWLIFLYRRFENTSKNCSLLLMNVISWFQNGMIFGITVFFERFILLLKLKEYKSLLCISQLIYLKVYQFPTLAKCLLRSYFTRTHGIGSAFTIMAVLPNQESSEQAVYRHRFERTCIEDWGQL